MFAAPRIKHRYVKDNPFALIDPAGLERSRLADSLRAGEWVTIAEAWRRWGCSNLGRRVNELRDTAGYSIECVWCSGKRYYKLAARHWTQDIPVPTAYDANAEKSFIEV